MADQDHRDAPGAERFQQSGKFLLEGQVHALGRLVQEKDLGLGQQHLGQGGPLLLPSGQIVGVAAQQPLQMAQGDDLLQTVRRGGGKG